MQQVCDFFIFSWMIFVDPLAHYWLASFCDPRSSCSTLTYTVPSIPMSMPNPWAQQKSCHLLPQETQGHTGSKLLASVCAPDTLLLSFLILHCSWKRFNTLYQAGKAFGNLPRSYLPDSSPSLPTYTLSLPRWPWLTNFPLCFEWHTPDLVQAKFASLWSSSLSREIYLLYS